VVALSYRVVNATRGETVADERELPVALQLAERLAEQCDHREVFAVVHIGEIYRTDKRRGGDDDGAGKTN
jgi:hypothetical protein